RFLLTARRRFALLDTSGVPPWRTPRSRPRSVEPLPSRLSRGAAAAGEAREVRPARELTAAAGDFFAWCAAAGPIQVVARGGVEGRGTGSGRRWREAPSGDGAPLAPRFIVTLRTESLGAVQVALTVKGE